MSGAIERALADWIAAGRTRIGEVAIRPAGDGFILTHWLDATPGSELEPFSDPHDAASIARYDDAGRFRPLKSAPSLRRGWRLTVRNTAELRLALDGLYPAMAGVLLAFQQGTLRPTPLRETLARQTGMYAAAKNLSDADADALVARTCDSRSNCLKTILWPIAPDRPFTRLPPEKCDPAADQLPGPAGPGLPLLCREACQILVAAAREEVKKGAPHQAAG